MWAGVIRVEGQDLVPLVFTVSRWGYKCRGRDYIDLQDCLEKVTYEKGVYRSSELENLAVEYPQALEFVELWILGRAPRFVVDQLTRHRLASFMVSSSRWGRVAEYNPVNYGDAWFSEKLSDLMDSVHNLVRECVERGIRKELCHRLVPPAADERVFLAKMNLREFAHMYCYRKYDGGQLETVKLLDMIRLSLALYCDFCAHLIPKFCVRWGYVRGEK